MACFAPLRAYRVGSGPVVFDPSKAGSGLPLDLPCGQCQGCRLARSREWALRITHEAQMHRASSFVTLTYDQAHVPKDGGLVLEHWQDFAKRMRAWLADNLPKERRAFRYYAVGEYGDRTLRPHYHACVFGQDFRDPEFGPVIGLKTNLYTSSCLSERWGHGNVSVGHLTWQSAAYVARYVMKKQGGNRAEAHYTRFDRNTGECWSVRPEFSTMSRRPGIGAKWFERYAGDVFPADEVVHEGKAHRPPRFYTSKLPEDVVTRLKAERRRKADLHKEDLTPQRLKDRQKAAVARLRQYKRNLD